MFDQSDPEKRSFDENRWNRVLLEDLGIKLTNKWIATDTDSSTAKWNAAIASGDVPDFAVVNDNIYKQLYDADMIADMGQILKDYGDPRFLSTISETDYQMMTMDGQLLGFPGGAKALAGSTLLFIRQDWLDRVGLSLPESIEDVANIARAFKAANLGGTETIGLMFCNNITGGLNFLGADGKWDGFFNGFGSYLNYWIKKSVKLEYSNIQPETRNALVAMQTLYREGVINRDLAAIDGAVAMEYVASGKVGIFYSTAWNVTQSMNSLAKTNPSAKIVNVYPPPSVKGATHPLQTNSPKGLRIFVSKKCKNPEAVVKMANLTYAYKFKDNAYYMEDAETFPYYKYLPWGDVFAPAEDDLLKSAAMRQAELSGESDTPLADASWENGYDAYKLAKEGKADPWPLMLYGPNGSFSTLYDAYEKGLLLFNGFNGLPTDTMSLKGDLINGELGTALFEVVMGADISIWDRAVEKWRTDGGTKITEEINAWYASLGN
jgi:putative aldouronate transport system substrate-binding protein